MDLRKIRKKWEVYGIIITNEKQYIINLTKISRNISIRIFIFTFIIHFVYNYQRAVYKWLLTAYVIIGKQDTSF